MASSLAGNAPEFVLDAGPYVAGDLAVLELRAEEAISTPFLAELTLVAREGVDVEPAAILGQTATVSFLAPDSPRSLHGIVTALDRWDTGGGADRHRYVVRLAPRLALLGQRHNCRIFQGLNVPQIVQAVLGEGQVAVRLALSAEYRARDYCVQYRESDLDFVSRLLEEEGIYYWFEHDPGEHTMVLVDQASTCEAIPGGAEVPFQEPSGMAGGEHVHAFQSRTQLRPGKVTLRDFAFFHPRLDLTAAAAAPAASTLEVYDYPGRYDDGEAGGRRARTRLEELRSDAQVARGESVSRRLTAGHFFQLAEHPIDDFNGDYLVLSVTHRAFQPQVLTAHTFDASEAGREGYSNEFVCLRRGVPYRPPQRTARPIVPGPQTAEVVGPAGEEIFTDVHGRIKVQFHWDREGRRDERSSCWIRVAQAWAGPGFGALFLPRIGHEVVVEFLEGDPDRPIVTGSVYNGQNPPPLQLPDDRTQSTLRTASTPGSLGANELRFEDAAGHEQVYLHAQRDLAIEVEHDKVQHVGGNETLAVDGDRLRAVGGNQRLVVAQDDSSTIGQDQTLAVARDRTTTVAGNHVESVGRDQRITIGGNSQVTVARGASESVGLAKALNVGGTYVVTVGAEMTEAVGAAKNETVGGAKIEVIGQDKRETVGGSRMLKVGGDMVETVEGSSSLKVGNGLAVGVTGAYHQSAGGAYELEAREITLSAHEAFTLQVGAATVQVSNSGAVVIKGTQVEVTAAGSLTLKGASIGEN